MNEWTHYGQRDWILKKKHWPSQWAKICSHPDISAGFLYVSQAVYSVLCIAVSTLHFAAITKKKKT